ncbi:MAG: hypothetical protein MSC30_15255 [Gaiellaceae bacterium MAG52_C11]|nr:hypothetical protein [Candidatus Gaiellasilicea maunaloa]
MAAFLAGGITQRVWVGSFGIKLPFVELADLPGAATASITAIGEVTKGLDDQIASVTTALNTRFDEQAEETAARAEAVARVSRAVSDLEERLGKLES